MWHDTIGAKMTFGFAIIVLLLNFTLTLLPKRSIVNYFQEYLVEKYFGDSLAEKGEIEN